MIPVVALYSTFLQRAYDQLVHDGTLQEQKVIDKDYFIEFEGFEGALYLYVNGQYVGYSTKNYTTSTFNLNNVILFRNYCARGGK